MGDTDPERKVSKGIGHLWSWAGFMAAQLWAINFAKKCELHQYAADNNESICCTKCSFHYEKTCSGMNSFRNGMNLFRIGMNSFRIGMKSFRMDTGIWGNEKCQKIKLFM